MTAFDASIARDVDEGILAWRARVLNILLLVYSVIALVPLIAILAGRGLELPEPLRIVCLVLYLILLLATLRPRWSVRVRAGVLLAISAVLDSIQLAVGQLAGHGRIALMLLPLLALLLVGPRTGWAALALGAALFALVPLWLRLKAGVVWGVAVPAVGASPAYWGLQWILWMIAMLVLMILFTRFQILQRRSMIAERLARRQLEAESADRQRLEAAIVRIGEEERRRLGAELHDGLCQHLTAALLNCSAMENERKADGLPDAALTRRIFLGSWQCLAASLSSALSTVGSTGFSTFFRMLPTRLLAAASAAASGRAEKERTAARRLGMSPRRCGRWLTTASTSCAE